VSGVLFGLLVGYAAARVVDSMRAGADRRRASITIEPRELVCAMRREER
jgi:hypothetical protein